MHRDTIRYDRRV